MLDKNNDIVIQRAENGHVILWWEDFGSEGKPVWRIKREIVSQHPTEECTVNDEDKVAFENLVYALAEKLGIEYDKFKETNLRISWDKKGHKI